MMFETYVPNVVDYNYYNYINSQSNHSKMLGGYTRPCYPGANFLDYASITGGKPDFSTSRSRGNLHEKSPCHRNDTNNNQSPNMRVSTPSNCKYMAKLNMRRRKTSLGSSVAIHKLRETKWFTQAEKNILCAVVESGFIIERQPIDEKSINKSHSDTTLSSAISEDSISCADFINSRILNDSHDKRSYGSGNLPSEDSRWGIVVWQQGKEKTKNPDNLSVFTAVQEKGNRFKIKEFTLNEFWMEDTKLRINNIHDKDKKPNAECNVRALIDYAQKNKSKWTDDCHFVKWCRYENLPEPRAKRISDYLRLRQMGNTAAQLFSNYNRKPSC